MQQKKSHSEPVSIKKFQQFVNKGPSNILNLFMFGHEVNADDRLFLIGGMKDTQK